MVLFDRNMKIRKYSKVDDILEELYEARLQYYKRRKNFLLSSLKRNLEILDNKVRFILAVINEEIVIKKVKKKDIINSLYKNGFTPMSKINSIKIKSQLDDEVVDNNADEEDSGAIVPAKDYDYLLSMNLWSLTYEKIEELLKNKGAKEKEIEILSSKTEKDLWETDLIEFVQVLDVILS
jgi:DNA topoisomerase-2